MGMSISLFSKQGTVLTQWSSRKLGLCFLCKKLPILGDLRSGGQKGRKADELDTRMHKMDTAIVKGDSVEEWRTIWNENK
jgi:hypothetical protein